MLNKNSLLMGRKKEQRKVKLTIGRYKKIGDAKYGYNKHFSFGSLDVVPYWGTTNDVMEVLSYSHEKTSFSAPSGITAFVKGYTQGITTGNAITGDIYSMDMSEGATRYLTFDPPPTGTWIQSHSNRSRKRLLRRRRSLGGSRC